MNKIEKTFLCFVVITLICFSASYAQTSGGCSADDPVEDIVTTAIVLNDNCRVDYTVCRGKVAPQCSAIKLTNCKAGRDFQNESYFWVLENYRSCVAQANIMYDKLSRQAQFLYQRGLESSGESTQAVADRNFPKDLEKCDQRLKKSAQEWVVTNCS